MTRLVDVYIYFTLTQVPGSPNNYQTLSLNFGTNINGYASYAVLSGGLAVDSISPDPSNSIYASVDDAVAACQDDQITTLFEILNGASTEEMAWSGRFVYNPAPTQDYIDAINDSLDALSTVASTGDYSDLSGTPTDVSEFANDAGYQIASDVTTAIATQKGAALGLAPLDSGGKVAAAYLPNTVMEYQGAWDPTGNSPSIADGTGNIGDLYRASVAGSRNLGSGSQTWAIGDLVIYNGSIWQHSPAADGVSSVFGRTGAVTANSGDYTTDQVTEGTTNKYFTLARVVGSLLTGLSTATNSAVLATDTLLVGIGKLQAQVSDIITNVGNKVDKVTGKVLSSNDFTNSYKAQLDTFNALVDARIALVTPGIESLTATTNASGDATFTFVKTYASPPRVFPAVIGGGNSTHGVDYQITSLSSTGCVVRAMRTVDTTIVLGGNVDPDAAITSATAVNLLVMP